MTKHIFLKLSQVSLIALLASTNVVFASSEATSATISESDLYPGGAPSSRSLVERYTELHGLGKDTDFEINSFQQLDRLDDISRFFAQRGLQQARENLVQFMNFRIELLQINTTLITPDQGITFWEKTLETLNERQLKDKELGASYNQVYMLVHHHLGNAHLEWMFQIGMLPIAMEGKTDHCKKAVDHLSLSKELGSSEESHELLDRAKYFLGVALFNDANKLPSTENDQKLALYQKTLALFESVLENNFSARQQYPVVKASIEALLKETKPSLPQDGSTEASSS